MSRTATLLKLRENMRGKRFCKDLNNPSYSVLVMNVCTYGNGFQVLFSYGEGSNPVFCGYGKFLKYYPHELSE